MGEYNRKQRSQLSRAIANSETGSRQLKGVVDNRLTQRTLNKVIQGVFTAGIGGDWHIHYEDHIKYSNNNGTRVNFDNRTKRQIFNMLGQKINNYGLAATTGNVYFIACRDWIRANID